MEPLTAGLIAAAPSLLGGLFSAFAPKPRKPLPTAPSLMGGQRFQPAQEEPRQGPTPGQLILDGIISGGLGALGAYAQQPTADHAAKITGEQTSLLAPKGTVSPGTLGINPLLRSNAAAIELMGQTPSLGGVMGQTPLLGGSVRDFDHTYQDYLDAKRIYGGI